MIQTNYAVSILNNGAPNKEDCKYVTQIITTGRTTHKSLSQNRTSHFPSISLPP